MDTASPNKNALMIRNMELIRNTIMERQDFLRRLLDPRRDIDAECGHPIVINTADYHNIFTRFGLATRVVSLLPEETWSQVPSIYETEDETETDFELAWKELDKAKHPLTYLLRGDVLSGVGRYGIVLLGIDDGKPLAEPVEGIGPDGLATKKNDYKLLFLRPLEEYYVRIQSLETDIHNPRFGQPLFYELQFLDSVLGNNSTVAMQCHWTRIIHLADNRTNSEVFATPRLEKVYDRLLDIKKILGGSAEMFWKGGFPGLSLQSLPGLTEDVTLDTKATKEQMEAYMNGLQRYIATIGMDVKSLSVQVADPEHHLEAQMRFIATSLAIPWRVFVGSEAAKLASTQDVQTWNRRLTRRREDYVSPFILRPFVDRLIAFGILPEPADLKEGYLIDWEDLDTPSDAEMATVAKDRTQALFQYVTGGCDVLIPPYHFLTTVLDFDDEEAQSVLDAAGGKLLETTAKILEPTPAPVLPGGPGGKAPPKKLASPPARGVRPANPARNGN